ncbi:MAG TPA: aminodeoxychorismate/anthranilate synthase component II [Flavobacteriaceae bacterium]|nr:aminodeoxychorismate/anthranilate synthase component II [Flavobacteriaceae bacterium]
MKKIAVIDNYDSFVYNLVHYLEECDAEVRVFRNDKLQLADIEFFDKIVLSPGPGLPQNAGMLNAVVLEYAQRKPILGVCLGQQAIAEAFGGNLRNLDKVYHGVSTPVFQLVDDEILFKGLPKKFLAGRYHSWIVENQLPNCLEATSMDEKGLLMSFRHKNLDVRAVQFHPESILTPLGKIMVRNWVMDF